MGRKAGLALFWKADWKVDLKSYSPGHIDIIVTDPNDTTGRFIGFYGNSVRDQRCISWELIRRLHSMCSLPWIGGDFNEILHLSEKVGGSNVSSASLENFR